MLRGYKDVLFLSTFSWHVISLALYHLHVVSSRSTVLFHTGEYHVFTPNKQMSKSGKAVFIKPEQM